MMSLPILRQMLWILQVRENILMSLISGSTTDMRRYKAKDCNHCWPCCLEGTSEIWQAFKIVYIFHWRIGNIKSIPSSRVCIIFNKLDTVQKTVCGRRIRYTCKVLNSDSGPLNMGTETVHTDTGADAQPSSRVLSVKETTRIPIGEILNVNPTFWNDWILCVMKYWQFGLPGKWLLMQPFA